MGTTSDLLIVEEFDALAIEYGHIPKIVMIDGRLTAAAKAIYAYFCAYAGEGDTASPSIGEILEDLGITKDTYYRHLKLLIGCGYIKITQQKIGSRFSENVYTLASNPAQQEQ